jgi:hypothetical protein
LLDVNINHGATSKLRTIFLREPKSEMWQFKTPQHLTVYNKGLVGDGFTCIAQASRLFDFRSVKVKSIEFWSVCAEKSVMKSYNKKRVS